jgi:hypothetical protein
MTEHSLGYKIGVAVPAALSEHALIEPKPEES